MYTENVSKIYLNKAKLRFFNNSIQLPFNTTIEERGSLCSELQGKGQYSPDFIIKGNFIKSSGKEYGKFYINDKSPTHILGITGISNNSSLDKYRLDKTVFSSLWEQNSLSYLFQIIKS